MLTKQDFIDAIDAEIDSYPTIAPLYRAGDPRIRQHIEASATMFAMLSSQIEVAQTEQFEKSRDGTILADAAMRGIVPKGKAARVLIKATNSGSSDFFIESGRNIIDSNGLYWRVETAVTVPAGGSADFEAVQKRFETVTHVVSGSEPFYAIQVPISEDGGYLCSLGLSDVDGDYEYRQRYTNTLPDERVYHVEADDRQNIFIRLGYRGVVATQPSDGHTFTITVGYTNGDVKTEYESPFSFEYLQSAEEGDIELKLKSLIEAGQNPISMDVLRYLAKYPSVYRDEAVFLGEFGFLVRKNFPTLQFLSVWNEAIEEQARGANISNVNALFVACLSEDGSEKVIEQDSDAVIEPEEIPSENLTGVQQAISEVIRRADDSYRVRFFTPVIKKLGVTVKARVSTSYRTSDVREKIKEVILAQYGKSSASSRRGRQQPLYREIYELCRARIPALTDGNADLQVVIDGYDEEAARPELWRFVDDSSLSVSVATANIVTQSWGG